MTTTHTQIAPLAVTVAQWIRGYGFTKAHATHQIVQFHLNSRNGRGNGNAARRRQDWLAAQRETAEWFDHVCRLEAVDIDRMFDEHRRECRWIVLRKERDL